jgi:NAD(P)-dependent dehydrogenase (short-subunit alcohol dehydrogenase family)
VNRLEGRVALIPGTARGPGRAAALRFAAEGALVVGGDPRHEGALETQRLIAEAGGTALMPGPLDPADETSVREWVGEAVAAFGGVDVLCVDAGAVRREAVDGQPYEDVVAAGPAPVWPAVRVASPHLVRSRGCLVLVGPAAGLAGPDPEARAAEGGVLALTRQLAAEGAPFGVRANCVVPGVLAPHQARGALLADAPASRAAARHVPPGRVGRPDEVALFLASAEAAHLTGAHLVVDGGPSAVLPD